MANYKLVFRRSVSKDLLSVPDKEAARILRRMEALREDPRPVDSEKLSGLECYRIRQGVYRIVYEVTDETLLVTSVNAGHREDVDGD